jgi:hypothetical protein
MLDRHDQPSIENSFEKKFFEATGNFFNLALVEGYESGLLA